MDMRRGLKKLGLFRKRYSCTYCGCPADTTDHTPPLCLLREPYPTNLMTVPACKQCNTAFSEDEAILGAILAHVSFEDDLIRAKHQGRTARAIRSDQKLKGLLERNTDENGIFWVTAEARRRMSRVVIKTVQGLYYRHYGRILSTTDTVVLSIEHQRRISVEDLFTRHCNLGTSGGIDGWPEVTPNGKALARVILGPPQEKGLHWVDYQPAVFRYTFSKGVENGLICIMDFHRTLAAVVKCPWPSRAGPIGGVSAT